MSFIEVETWKLRAGTEAEHEVLIRRWFAYLRDHHAELFAEWKSTRHFHEVDADGTPTGRYVMLFEFYSREGHHAYKERRKDWSGPYAEYKTVDPYHLFDTESVTVTYWEPQEQALWFDFGALPSDLS